MGSSRVELYKSTAVPTRVELQRKSAAPMGSLILKLLRESTEATRVALKGVFNT